MKILIDNGHGAETPGKRSPDGSLREYAYTRQIADRVVSQLQKADIEAVRIVLEESDVSLQERVARANKIYADTNKQAVLISIHCNAMGSGEQWMAAHGWSVFVDTIASDKSRLLATEIAKVAKSKKVVVRQQSPDSLYWTSNLYICKHTNCPTILIENFFQDNKGDVAFLLSEEGMKCVTDIAVEGVVNYLKNN